MPRFLPLALIVLWCGGVMVCGCGGGPEERIRWHRWSADTFALAAEEDKPIFLYSAPAWARSFRVATDSIFSRSGIVSAVNTHFIPVRETREDRPDLGRRYGDGVQPVLTVLDRNGHALMDIRYDSAEKALLSLTRARELYIARPERDAGGDGFRNPRAEDGEETFTGDLVFAAIRSAYDLAHGGFSGAVKVPRPRVIEYLLQRLHATNDHHVEQMALETLTRMDKGRIHCRSTGGFKWMSRGGTWDAPLNELPLELNAGLLKVYIQAGLLTGDDTYLQCAGRIVDFMAGSLLGPDSLFATALYHEGDTSHAEPVYLTGENGLAAEALTAAWAALKQPRCLHMARAVVERLSRRRDAAGELLARRSLDVQTTGPQLLTDQVRALRGMMAVYESCGDDRYLLAARDLAVQVKKVFYDDEEGGFFNARHRHRESAFLKGKDLTDNCRLLRVLRRIDFAMAAHEYQKCTEKTVALFRQEASRLGMEAACYAGLLEMMYAQPVEFFFVRQPDDWSTPQLIREAKRHFLPMANIKHYIAKKKGLRRGALIFPYFLRSVGYVSINGRIHGAFDEPKALGDLLDRKGY